MKKILIRTVYNTYLKDKSLVGEKMLDIYAEICRVILVNRGIYVDEKCKEPDWFKYVGNAYSNNSQVIKLN